MTLRVEPALVRLNEVFLQLHKRSMGLAQRGLRRSLETGKIEGLAQRFDGAEDRAAHPPGQGADSGLQGQAGHSGRAGKGKARGPAQVQVHQEQKDQAYGNGKDHHGQVHPAHSRGAGRQEIPQHGGPQLLLGWRGRKAQVVRGHPDQPQPSGYKDGQGPELGVRDIPQGPGGARQDQRRQARARAHGQGQRRREETPEHQVPRH